VLVRVLRTEFNHIVLVCRRQRGQFAELSHRSNRLGLRGPTSH
jgi:hypothetical protein